MADRALVVAAVNPLTLVLGVVALVTSATTRVNVAGHPVPVLWLLALSMVLTLAVAVLVLLRLLVRDGLRLSPRLRTVA